MIPANVLAALGVSFADLLASVEVSGSLREAYGIAKAGGDPRGIFSRFVGQYFAANPDATRAEATAAYREAKAWSNLGSTWERLAPDLPIDPNLYRPSTAFGEYAGEYGGFITRVRVTITDPETGDTRTYGINIHDFMTWSTNDLGVYAVNSVEDIIGHSPTVGGATDLDGLDVTYEITDLVQII